MAFGLESSNVVAFKSFWSFMLIGHEIEIRIFSGGFDGSQWIELVLLNNMFSLHCLFFMAFWEALKQL